MAPPDKRETPDAGLADGRSALAEYELLPPGMMAAVIDLRAELRSGLEGIRAELRRQQETLIDVRTSVGNLSGNSRRSLTSRQGASARSVIGSSKDGAAAPGPAGEDSDTLGAGAASRPPSRAGSAAESLRSGEGSKVGATPDSKNYEWTMASDADDPDDDLRAAHFTNITGWKAARLSWQVKARRLTAAVGGWIDVLTGVMIVANSGAIGWEIQNNLDGFHSPTLHALEHVFLVYFLLELGLRVLANEKHYMRTGWFVLEAVLVVVGIVGSWIVGPLLGVAKQRNEAVDALDTFLVLRVLRVMRLLRALRLLEFFAELWKLCNGLLVSFKTVLSACILVFMTIYIFACLGVEAIAASSSLQDDPVTSVIVQSRFNSLLKTILTLLAFTNADSISSVYEPIITVNPAFGPFFACVWLIVTVSLMNLVTAVIVDTAISQSAADDEQRRHELRRLAKKMVPEIEELFLRLDHSGDGNLEVKELDLTGIKLPSDLKAFIDEEKLKDLFQFLDIDGSGEVDKAEFVDGIMHLVLQSVPIETTQTLQLLRLQQKTLADLTANMKQLLGDESDEVDAEHRPDDTQRDTVG